MNASKSNGHGSIDDSIDNLIDGVMDSKVKNTVSNDVNKGVLKNDSIKINSVGINSLDHGVVQKSSSVNINNNNGMLHNVQFESKNESINNSINQNHNIVSNQSNTQINTGKNDDNKIVKSSLTIQTNNLNQLSPLSSNKSSNLNIKTFTSQTDNNPMSSSFQQPSLSNQYSNSVVSNSLKVTTKIETNNNKINELPKKEIDPIDQIVSNVLTDQRRKEATKLAFDLSNQKDLNNLGFNNLNDLSNKNNTIDNKYSNDGPNFNSTSNLTHPLINNTNHDTP